MTVGDSVEGIVPRNLVLSISKGCGLIPLSSVDRSVNGPSFFFPEFMKWYIENWTRIMQASFRCVSHPNYTCQLISDSLS